MQDCIFCKIVKGEIPSYKVYEDDDFLAFLDAFPSFRGHTLIVPKKHYENIFELPDKLAQKVMLIGKNIATAMEKSINADGYNFVQNNKETAGQAVMHYHLHIIPRYSNTPKGASNIFHPQNYEYKPTEEELEETAKLIREAIA